MKPVLSPFSKYSYFRGSLLPFIFMPKFFYAMPLQTAGHLSTFSVQLKKTFETVRRLTFVTIRFMRNSLIDLYAPRVQRQVREKTLLLVQMNHIGDYVLARNFIRFMKENADSPYRDHAITLCANEDLRGVADFFDEGCYKDYIWVNRDRLLNDYSYRCTILRGVARKGFTTAIQPSYAREYHWGDSIIRASRAGKRIGSSGNLGNTAWWQKKIADRFYTRLIPARREVLFEFIRNREFFETLLGTPIPFTKPDLPASSISVPLSIKERYAVIAPGGSTENKRWTTAGFGQVARYLNGKYGLTIVIAGGPLEGEISSAVADSANVPGCIVIAGQTSIAQLAKYLSGAAILVSNDSTAVHLSVAVNTPVVQLLNGAHFGRFGPYPADVFGRTRSVFPPEIAGQMRNNIPFEVLGKRYEASVPLDIKSIKLQDVIMAIDSLLQSDKSCGF